MGSKRVMEEKRRIMVVEDDGDINRLLVRILEKEGYETLAAFSGTEARLLLTMEKTDLILLDLMLPGLSGEELIRFIRQELGREVPIVVLSAKSSTESKVEVITIGADDYITKPFQPEEVAVRVMAALRRCGGGLRKTEENIRKYKNLVMEHASRRVKVNGEEIALTPHEYDILWILMEEPGRVHSRESIYEKVWQNGYYGEDNTVNVHVSNIRKKIAALDASQEYIKTVWGIGFQVP